MVRKNITFKTYERVKNYIKKNQPIKHKSDISVNEKIDHYSVQMALDLLRKQKLLNEENGDLRLWE